jgi:hypothetical protein
MSIINVVNAVGVTQKVASYGPCSLQAIVGTWRGAADVYLQVYNEQEDPGNGVSDYVFCQLVYAAAAFTIELPLGIPLERGCFVVFSTTAATLTEASGTGNVGDLAVFGDGMESADLLTEAGSMLAGAEVATVWSAANAAVALKLKRLEVTAFADADAVAYIQLYPLASGDSTAGVKPLFVRKIVPSEVIDMWFDWRPSITLGVPLLVRMSSTPESYSACVASNKYYIRATRALAI